MTERFIRARVLVLVFAVLRCARQRCSWGCALNPLVFSQNSLSLFLHFFSPFSPFPYTRTEEEEEEEERWSAPPPHVSSSTRPQLSRKSGGGSLLFRSRTTTTTRTGKSSPSRVVAVTRFFLRFYRRCVWWFSRS